MMTSAWLEAYRLGTGLEASFFPAQVPMRCCAQWLLACSVFALCIGFAAAAADAEPKRVLLLYDERIELPGLSALDASLARALDSKSNGGIEIFRESMDRSRFDSDAYPALLRDYLREKYARKKIDAIVAVMEPSLQFLLRHADTLFPATPIVFCGVDRRDLHGRALPPRVTGVVLQRRFLPTVELALRMHPDTRRIAVVAGSSSFDLEVLEQARTELEPLAQRVAFDYLLGHSVPDLLARLSRLPSDTLVLYTTLFQDAAGHAYVPHEVVEKLSAAANRPIYGFVDQYVGRGIVGGHLYSLNAHGEQAAGLVLQVLAGASPSALPLVQAGPGRPMFDAHQLRRWSIDESQLPADSVVLFRDRTLWNDYRLQVIAAAALIVVQALMIGSLLLQRARRRRAELAAAQLRFELAHAGRLATMGELIAAMAHEVNQPLGAMLANISSAELLLEKDQASLDSLREILTDLRRDDLRASAVVERLRALLSKQGMTSGLVDMNEACAEVIGVLEPASRERQIELATAFEPSLPAVRGDRVHLQQVLLNLIVNAMDAMAHTPPAARRVLVKTAQDKDDKVLISVADRGHGIPREKLSQVFDSFFTTKPRGMGLGLSIARSIISAHGGRIWVVSDVNRGTTFWFTLPTANEGRRGRPFRRGMRKVA